MNQKVIVEIIEEEINYYPLVSHLKELYLESIKECKQKEDQKNFINESDIKIQE